MVQYPTVLYKPVYIYTPVIFKCQPKLHHNQGSFLMKSDDSGGGMYKIGTYELLIKIIIIKITKIIK